jgi:Na+/H+-dicarboxylate symporter
MLCSTSNPATRRYTVRFFIAMALYCAFLFTAVWSFRHYHPVGPLAYLLAVLPAIPIVACLVIVGIYLAEEKDEFQRNLFIQSAVCGIGATLAVTTVWGFLELFIPVAHFQLYLVFPMFWFFVGLSTPLVKLRYR